MLFRSVGKAFGRARPATGFSMDLKALLAITPDAESRAAILGPETYANNAATEIARLRKAGEIVIARLPGEIIHRAERGCDRELKYIDGRWSLVPLS